MAPGSKLIKKQQFRLFTNKILDLMENKTVFEISIIPKAQPLLAICPSKNYNSEAKPNEKRLTKNQISTQIHSLKTTTKKTISHSQTYLAAKNQQAKVSFTCNLKEITIGSLVFLNSKINCLEWKELYQKRNNILPLSEHTIKKSTKTIKGSTWVPIN